MPTRDQMETVMEQLEKLTMLPASERDAAMAAMDWAGFTEAEKLDVERRIQENEPEEFWMDGVEENRVDTRSDFDCTLDEYAARSAHQTPEKDHGQER